MKQNFILILFSFKGRLGLLFENVSMCVVFHSTLFFRLVCEQVMSFEQVWHKYLKNKLLHTVQLDTTAEVESQTVWANMDHHNNLS